MVNKLKVEGMVRNLRQYVSYLHDIAQIDRETFLQDPATIGGARYYLQISIETCLNIGNHIIAAQDLRAPKEYRDVFTVLNEAGILPDDFASTLRQMVGFRNRLVHLYWEIDDERVYGFLQTELGDFDRFVEQIMRFLETEI